MAYDSRIYPHNYSAAKDRKAPTSGAKKIESDIRRRQGMWKSIAFKEVIPTESDL
ncbi:MAG: hypothetical protein ACC651_09845 [Candidatus Scalindua sp.]